MGFDLEGARKAGYSDAEIADYMGASAKFDSAGARKSGYADNEIIAHLQGAAPMAEKPSIAARAADVLTGNLRKTKETESLPDWAGMPELNQLSMASAKTGVGTLLSDPKETAQIIQANYPDAKVRQDEKGNYLITSSVDGKEYAIKPAFRVSDIPRAIAGLLAFTPAGKAATIPGAALAAGATQAVIEGSQAATGGSFDPGNVGATALIGAAAPMVAGLARTGVDKVRQILAATGREAPAVDAAAAPLSQPMQPSAPAVAAPVVQPVSAQAAPVAAEAATLPAQELAQTAKKAAEGGLGSSRAKRILAGQAAPDAETVEAAKRLGIQDHLQPDHVTTNQAFRELSQAVKSVPGSAGRAAELDGLQAVAKRADDIITELGGSKDMSGLNEVVRGRMDGITGQLSKEADDLYAAVRAKLPATAQAPADNALQFVKQRAKELGGSQNLSPMEKSIYSKLTPKKGTAPSYALLDDVRRDLGSVAGRSGPFKDADTGLAKKLYALLSEDQAAAAEKFGVGDIYGAAKSAVQVRKGFEDDMVSLFGRNLDRSFVGNLSDAVVSLSKGDSAKLAKVMSAIPADMREQAATSGLTAAFGRNAKDGTLNFNTFSKWWDGIEQNQQAKSVLMSALPAEARQQLTDLARVSRGIAMSSRERIHTGRLESIRQELQGADTLMGNLYGVAKRASAGLAAEAITTPMGAPGVGLASGIASALTKGKPDVMKAADALISSPEFVQMARASSKPAQQAAAASMARGDRFKRFAKLAGRPQEMSDGQRWVLSAIQAKQGDQK